MPLLSTRSASDPSSVVPLSTPLLDAAGGVATGHVPMMRRDGLAVPVSDTDPMPVRGQAGPMQDASSVVGSIDLTVLAANPNRRYLHIENVGTSTLKVGIGHPTASVVGCVILGAGDGGAGGMMTFGAGSGYVPTDAIHVSAASPTGGAVTVKWF